MRSSVPDLTDACLLVTLCLLGLMLGSVGAGHAQAPLGRAGGMPNHFRRG